MSKNRILAIVIAAVVVVAAAVASVVLIKNGNAAKSEVPSTDESATVQSTEQTSQMPETVTILEEVSTEEAVTDDQGQTVVDENGEIVTRTVIVNRVVTVVANEDGTPKVDNGTTAVVENGTTKASPKTTKATGKTTKASGKTTKATGKTTKSTKKNPSGETNTYAPAEKGAVEKILEQLDKKQVAGYRYNAKEGYFYTDDKECWQYGFGYNEIYDQAAGLGVMYIDKLRIRFDYGGKAWMLEHWKGQYGWLFVGAEIGVYTRTDKNTGDINNNDINHYDCAAKDDWLKMQMDFYWDRDMDGTYDLYFTRDYDYYWWCTGFVDGLLNKMANRNELKVGARITFKTTEMATLYTNGMKKAGFKSATSSNNLHDDTIFQNGKDVYFLWKAVISTTYTDYEKTTRGDEKTTLPKTTTTITVPERG